MEPRSLIPQVKYMKFYKIAILLIVIFNLTGCTNRKINPAGGIFVLVFFGQHINNLKK